jgi:cell division protein FtsL
MRATPTRRAIAAALVVPALVIAALAARSYRPFGGDGGSDRAASTTFVDSMFTIALVLAAVVLALGVLWFRFETRGARAKRQSSGLGILVAYLIVVLLAVAVGRGLVQRKHEIKGPPGEGGALAFPKPVNKTPTASPGQLRAPQFVWPLAAGIGALLAVVAITAVVVSHRRRLAGTEASEGALAELRQALDDAIEDLRREPDPRLAVVAAYARMEQALSVYGLPRHPAEAPYEYLGRVAKELEAEESVADLTELFELAKFSERAVDEAMRGQAIAALSAVRDEVRIAA